MRDYFSLISVILAMVGVLMLAMGVNWMVCVGAIIIGATGFVYSDEDTDGGE